MNQKNLLLGIFFIACSSLVTYETVEAEDLGREKIHRLSSLAEAAYSDNQYQQAINWWLKIIEQKPSSVSQEELALIQSNIASTSFQIGEYGAAIRHWNISINIYRETEDTQFSYLLAASLIDQARAYLALGQTHFATKRLDEAFNLIKKDIQADKLNTLLTTAYLSLGNTNILQGQYLEAEKNYYKSLEYASTPRERTVVQNNLSKLFWTRAQNSTISPQKSLENRRLAVEAAKKAVKISENIPSLVTVEALLQLVKVSKGKQNFNQDYYVQKAEIILSTLPHSVRKVYTLINLSKFKENPVPTLMEAQKIAQQIQDYRSSSFVLGYVGKYYFQKKQYEKAIEWTNQAKLAASTTQADDSLYQWEWQQARIHRVLGQTDQAIRAYENAISSLQRIRSDLAIAQEKQIDFELEIEPVYRELIELLLSNNPSPQKIKRALEIRDLLQLSELENYFGDHCLEIDKDEQTLAENIKSKIGLVHTIILPKQTYLILQTQNDKIKSFKIDINSSQLEKIVQKWRLNLESRHNDNYLFPGRQIYDLLVKPIESELALNKLDTLIFINDGILRNIPMSALHDGNQFLVEKYALSTSLGLNIQFNNIKQKIRKTKILAFGLSSETETFSSLPYVKEEINLMRDILEVKQYLDTDFLADRVTVELTSQNFPLVHIATHAEFNGTLEDSFLETYQGRISLIDLENILSNHQIKFPQNPIALLTLSACETAAGNKRAILGLAGVAIRSGVRNTVGSLWSVNDIAQVQLIENFYRGLIEDKLSPDEALRQAQINMIRNHNFHPAIWSNLILVVN